MKCEKPEQPTNDQDCSDKSQHKFISLHLGAKMRVCKIAHSAQSQVRESVAGLACAWQREMSVHLGTRVRALRSTVILADLAMRGLAISFVTLSRVASLSCFLTCLRRMHHRDTESEALQSHLAQSRDIGSVPAERVARLKEDEARRMPRARGWVREAAPK